MHDVTIRPAEAADSEALTAVVRAAYAPWRQRLPDLPDVAAGLDADIGVHVVAVACRDSTGGIVGGIVLRLTSDTAHVMNLAVDPDAGGAGIGRALLTWAEDRARATGLTDIGLATHRDIAPTLAFYARRGWRISGSEGNRVFLRKSLC